ncbi:hypothetical protein [Micromonospora avicenniae]|uniref:Uncharacterized protein n=1 Tax=Micromonospora avicenniae TaxID=1198245 RepID=A0A1N6XTM1_9ACTN|nr:hypothetical protein [Micromonospora avicenniae]SIR05670.1 hypothetical protein SAMN05444858_10614 [Micromonospora avicenniae]
MRFARPAGLLLAAVAAVLWAVNMTVLQPLTEPVGPWPEALPGNNTYWARDLRFAAIVAVVLGLVLAGRGDSWWARPAVLLGGVWIAADLAVDRADPTGAGPTVLLAAAGCAVVAAFAALCVRLGRSAARPGAYRRTLTGAACVAGALTLVTAGIESPTDREPELHPAAFGTATLLLLLAVSCALAAAPAPSRARSWLAVAVGVAGVLGVLFVRATSPGSGLLHFPLLGAVLFTGVTVLAWNWPAGRPDWGRHGLAALAGLIGPTAMLIFVMLISMWLRIGAPLNALAGNTPINSADSDVLYSFAGVLVGLGMALLLAWPPALDGGPGAARPAVPPPVGTRG